MFFLCLFDLQLGHACQAAESIKQHRRAPSILVLMPSVWQYKTSCPAGRSDTQLSIFTVLSSLIHPFFGHPASFLTWYIMKQSIFAFAISLSSVTMAIVLPLPSNNSYEVAVEIQELIDTTRMDPFANNSNTPRAIMASVYYPLESTMMSGNGTSAYMGPATAKAENQDYADYGWPSNVFETLQLPVMTNSTAGAPVLPGAPVIIFSPALATCRQFYSAIAQSIANQGYIVATVDHPYDAAIVEFPDGQVIEAIELDNDGAANKIDLDVDTRAKDVIFLMNQMADGTFHLGRSVDASSQSSSQTSLAIDVSRVVMAGHSLGGATAVSALLMDPRVVGAANLDGEFIGPAANSTFHAPVLVFASNGTDDNTKNLWNQAWPNLQGWKHEILLANSKHSTLSDVPLLVHTLSGNNVSRSALDELGTIDGVRVRDILQTYLTAFFNFAFTNQTNPLLEGPSPDFPEITFVRGLMAS